MFSFELQEKEIIEYRNFHKSILPKRESDFKIKKVELYKGIFILNKCVKLLEKKNITDYEILKSKIEVHQRNCGFENNNILNFNWNIENFNVLPQKVYTIIFYIRKDHTIKGGNWFYKYKNEVYNNKSIEINSGKILLFEGLVRHSPQKSIGFGCRDIITVFIKKTT